ncbi:MAG: radical SAM protein [bacterium]|nr:radical SAM protein [bacterium]
MNGQAVPAWEGLLGENGLLGMEGNALSAPLLVLLEVTRACNLRCRHCAALGGEALANELDALEIVRLIDECGSLGVLFIFWSGGEPLLRPDLFDLMEHATSLGIASCLITSGTLVSRVVAHQLKSAGVVKVEVNLDSHRPEVFDYFRGSPGALEATIRGTRVLMEEGIPVRANACITSLNAHEVPALARFAMNLGLKELALIPFHPSGRGRQNATELELASHLLEGYRATWMELKRELMGALYLLFEGGGTHMPEELVQISHVLPSCGAGRLHCSITPVGDVKICPYFPDDPAFVAGSIREGSLRRIWTESDLLALLRRRRFEGCEECDVTHCAGGCRLRAFRDTGTLTGGPDPACPYLRGSG